MFQKYLLNSWILTDNHTPGVWSWTPNESFILRKIHISIHHCYGCTQKHIWHTVFTGRIWACASEDQANEGGKKAHNFSENKMPSAFPFSLSLVLNIHRHMQSTTLTCKSRLWSYILTQKEILVHFLWETCSHLSIPGHPISKITTFSLLLVWKRSPLCGPPFPKSSTTIQMAQDISHFNARHRTFV